MQKHWRQECRSQSLIGRLGALVPFWMVQAHRYPLLPALRMASQGEQVNLISIFKCASSS